MFPGYRVLGREMTRCRGFAHLRPLTAMRNSLQTARISQLRVQHQCVVFLAEGCEHRTHCVHRSSTRSPSVTARPEEEDENESEGESADAAIRRCSTSRSRCARLEHRRSRRSRTRPLRRSDGSGSAAPLTGPRHRVRGDRDATPRTGPHDRPRRRRRCGRPDH